MECLRTCANRGDVHRCFIARGQNPGESESVPEDGSGEFFILHDEDLAHVEQQRKSRLELAEQASKSRFRNVQCLAFIEHFDVNKAFDEDAFKEKVNLAALSYRGDDGKPWVLPVVRKVEEQLAKDYTLNKESLPVIGSRSFITSATALLLGNESPAILAGTAAGIQTVGGTCALRITAEFLFKALNFNTVYDSDETWPGYKQIFTDAGFTNYRSYRYWDNSTKGLDFDGWIDDLKNAPENAVVILQTCAHNPTGVDPTHRQWGHIAKVIKDRNLFPVFDTAYQGLVSGDVDKDVWPLRYFVQHNMEFICCTSFSKNFGLYSERVGHVLIVSNDIQGLNCVISQLTVLVQGFYYSPQGHGSRIVATVLNDPVLLQDWKDTVNVMRERIKCMRLQLKKRLIKLGTPGSHEYLTHHVGLFSNTGLTPRQVDYLRVHYHIYMLRNGRINICGLTTDNLEHVAIAFHDVITNHS